MADEHDDIDELEGDIDIEDFKAWQILDEVDDNQCKNENSKNQEAKTLSLKQKAGSMVEKLKILSKSIAVVSIKSSDASSHISSSKDVCEEMSIKERKLENPDIKFSSSTELAKSRTRGKNPEANNIFSGIGDIAGIFGNIDSQVVDIVKSSSKVDASPKHLVKKTPKIGMKETDVVEIQDDSKPGQSSAIVKDADACNSNNKETSEEAKVDTDSILELEKEAKKLPHESDDQENKDKMKRGELVTGSTVPGSCEENETDTPGILTEEQSKLVDLNIAMEMVKGVKNKPLLHTTGEKYVVTFSPVEIADLAEASVQSLIQSQPSLFFFFRKQMGKFKKKKGYGEVLLSKSDEVKDLLLKLIPIKLIEKDIEITITGTFQKWKNFNGSFSLNLKKAHKLLKLIHAGGNPFKTVPIAMRKNFVIEDVPSDATFVACKTLFPFSTFVVFQKENEQRPVKIFYNDWSWLNAVLDCCSDFKLNDQSLTIQVPVTKEDSVLETVTETKQKTPQEEEKPQTIKEEGGENKDTDVKINEEIIEQLESKKPHAIQDVTDKSHKVTDKSHKVTDKSHEVTEESHEVTEESHEVTEESHEVTEESLEEDDGITNMTRDVCSDMLESLNKLRELETDNPNVQKILEMQSQLAKLQKSLSKKGTSGMSLEDDVHNLSQDPWAVDSSDTPAKYAGRESLSVEDTLEGGDSNKQLNEMEYLQKLIEKEYESDRTQAERFKHLQVTEMKKRKDLEERRKASWAKKMIEEGKESCTGKAEGKDSTKEQALRLLKAREERLQREKEVEGKRKEEEENKKAGAQTAEDEKKRWEEEKAEEKQQRKDQELQAQQKLREELERASQKQIESSSGWDQKAILQTFQETFSSFSGSKPSPSKNEIPLSEGDKSAGDKSTSDKKRKRNIFEADLENSDESLKHPKYSQHQ